MQQGSSRVGLTSNVEGFGTADGLPNVHTAMHVTCRVAHTVSPESNAFKVLTRGSSTTTSGTDLPDLSLSLHRSKKNVLSLSLSLCALQSVSSIFSDIIARK